MKNVPLIRIRMLHDKNNYFGKKLQNSSAWKSNVMNHNGPKKLSFPFYEQVQETKI